MLGHGPLAVASRPETHDQVTGATSGDDLAVGPAGRRAPGI